MDVRFEFSSVKVKESWRVTTIAALYNAIYNYVLSQTQIAELTVEDPAEAFEDLRDRNDLRMLLDRVAEGLVLEVVMSVLGIVFWRS